MAAPLALAAPAFASADRLISIPVGYKIPYETVRLEFAGEPYAGGLGEAYLGAGIGTTFDAEVRTQRLRGERGTQALDVGYNIIGPIADFGPGLGVGCQDVGDSTSDGRRFYAVATWRQTSTTPNGDAYTDLTMGVFLGVHASAFLGVSLPINRQLRMLVENNGYRNNAGLEFRPTPALAFRFYIREQQGFASIQLTKRF